MSETMVIAIVVGVIIVIGIIVIGRRLTGVSVTAGPLSGKLDGQKPGASVTDSDFRGSARASRHAARVERSTRSRLTAATSP